MDCKDISQYAVLNANYLLARLRDTYHVPFDRICMHEFVAEGRFEGSDVRALDIAKRLMDYNFHPPTNYFPLIVHEALMIEPTETENKDTLDAFADALIKIAEEAKTQPELLHKRPAHHALRQNGRGQGGQRAGAVLLAAGRLPGQVTAHLHQLNTGPGVGDSGTLFMSLR